ncbi:uncharacterized protein LOC130419568 [Triplophysa dalaica]|uniref:uncharacterized protein LOC130419568 n=1 Tax=Triplophysa dalaica TaxID=1582913 RepID=UPI0024DF5FE4|nr:uncharacterized protein LOC130419568 [Triplophysa dalaica]
MDSAEQNPLHSAVSQQGILLGQQETRLNTASQEIGILHAQIADLSARFQHAHNEATTRGEPFRLEPEPHVNNPPVYSGDTNSCRAFLSQCSLVFNLQPRRFSSEASKVSFVLTLLCGSAREWGMAVWDARAPCCASFETFRKEMEGLFDRSVRGDEAAAKLSRLSQGRISVTEYAIQFQTLSAACEWNAAALRACFLEGLNDTIADELAGRITTGSTSPTSTDEQFLAPNGFSGSDGQRVSPPTSCGVRTYAAGTASTHSFPETPTSHPGALSLLWEAGPSGHQVPTKSQRPLVDRRLLVGKIFCPLPDASRTQLCFVLEFQGSSHSGLALLDSGAEGNFIDRETARRWNIPSVPLSTPVPARSLGGALLFTITHCTPCLPCGLFTPSSHSRFTYLLRGLSAVVASLPSTGLFLSPPGTGTLGSTSCGRTFAHSRIKHLMVARPFTVCKAVERGHSSL